MDFKSTCIFIAFIAIGGGIVMGWKQFQDEKSARQAPAGITGRKPTEKAGREPVAPPREPENREPEQAEPVTPQPITPAVKIPDPIDLSISAAEEAEEAEAAEAAQHGSATRTESRTTSTQRVRE